MKKIVFISMLVVLLFSLAACAPTTSAPAETDVVAEATETLVEETVAPAIVGESVLEIDGNDTALNFTIEELQALPATEGYAGLLSSSGSITPPALHKGVSLKDLVDQLGGMSETMGVYVEAVDGYGITFSYDQVMSGEFITYDPANGTEISVEGPLTAIIAYEREGELLDPVQDGQLRLVIVSPEPDNLVDGHWMVKWVNHIELRDTGANWFLHLEGAISEEMDRATFESGSSAHCHLEVWTDENGDEWSGIPLWYLLGRVDDAVRHESRAFDEDLAESGYTITITAADGYSIELNSQDAAFNDDWIIASHVNGEPIADKNYPLRLVGNGLEKGQMIGAIESITLGIEPIAESVQETQVPVTDMTGDLVIFGNVDFTLPFMYAELQDMDVVTITAKHPKKDETREYQGVLLKTLLDMVKPKTGASKLKFIAGDGYSIEVPLADVTACQDCMLSFGDDETMNSVMPGMESSAWVKDVVQIIIQ